IEGHRRDPVGHLVEQLVRHRQATLVESGQIGKCYVLLLTTRVGVFPCSATENPHSQLPGTAHRIDAVRKLGQFAYRRRRGLTIVAGLVAVASALGGATVFDNVKPFGFQDPSSQSSRAYAELRDATGQRPIPEVEILVHSSSGGGNLYSDA